MRIRTQTISLAGIVAIATILASCGGATTSDAPLSLQTGNGTLPGVVGSLGGGVAVPSGNLYGTEPATVDNQAPLGLDETYSPGILGGQAEYQDTRGTSSVVTYSHADDGKITVTPLKGASLVTGPVDGPGFQIIDLTMVPDNAAADFNLTTNTFTEGQSIDLWIKYQMDSTANGQIIRHWTAPDLGLNKTESGIVTPKGVYTVKLDWTVPANSAKNNCVFQWDMTAYGTKKYSDQFLYNIVKPKPTSGFDVIDLVMMPDGVTPDWNLNHAAFHEGDKIDLWIQYELYSTSMTMDRHWVAPDLNLDYPEVGLAHTKGVYSVKLDYVIPFIGAKTNSIFKFDVTGSSINKVSNNFLFDVLTTPNTTAIYPPAGGIGDTSVTGYGAGWAQLAIEDLVTNSDYDFNDFVARMQATEYRNAAGDLIQINMKVKAIARGAGYDAQWQFNFGAAFPGATAFARVDQYYQNGTRHGNEILWKSSNGLAIPIFAPTKSALPPPTGTFATNTVSGTKWVDGDYAVVTIFFDKPVLKGTYSPMPYRPELRVMPPGGPTYIVTYSAQTDDGWQMGTQAQDGSGPLGFIVPDTWAWPLEYQPVWNSYAAFLAWGTWAQTPNAGNIKDPNTYMLATTPLTGASQFGGTPQVRSYWTGSTGQDEFHNAAPTGQLSTLNLIKYLNGDGTMTSTSISKVVLNPLKTTKTYFTTGLPLSTASINNTNNTSSGYTTLKSYISGATTSKPIEYQLGAELTTLVLNVERGRIKPDEWTYIPELGQIRAVVGDSRITSQQGVIAAANAAFALATSTQNDATKTTWFKVCQRLNANTYFVTNQPKPEPTPRWYNMTPSGTGFFKRSLFL
jgi:hypothetical protein